MATLTRPGGARKARAERSTESAPSPYAESRSASAPGRSVAALSEPALGAHALGAAAYAVKAASLAAPNRPQAVTDEIRWQLRQMSPAVSTALRQLPPVGENAAGPLGPGLLASGEVGAIIRGLQAGLAPASLNTQASG